MKTIRCMVIYAGWQNEVRQIKNVIQIPSLIVKGMKLFEPEVYQDILYHGYGTHGTQL